MQATWQSQYHYKARAYRSHLRFVYVRLSALSAQRDYPLVIEKYNT